MLRNELGRGGENTDRFDPRIASPCAFLATPTDNETLSINTAGSWLISISPLRGSDVIIELFKQIFIYLFSDLSIFELDRARCARRRAQTLVVQGLHCTTMSSKPLLPKTNPPSSPSTSQMEPKIRGANRSTKTTGKLKVLPDQPTTPGPATGPTPELDESPNVTGDTDEGDDEEEEADEDDEEGAEGRLRQISRIPQGTARRDALRLTKKKAKSLPRVTAYATAQYVSFHFIICLARVAKNLTSW